MAHCSATAGSADQRLTPRLLQLPDVATVLCDWEPEHWAGRARGLFLEQVGPVCGAAGWRDSCCLLPAF